ncbi:MAG: metallophosphoesterase [Myxococcales bacterium]|nr:metallophosphoesterase [Myxococcales bacterium]
MALADAAGGLWRSVSFHPAATAVFHGALVAVTVALLKKRPIASPRDAIVRCAQWTLMLLGLVAFAAVSSGDFFFAFNLLSHAVFAHAPVLGAYVAFVLVPRPWKLIWSLISLTLVAIMIDAFVVEPTSLTVRRETITSDKLRRPLRAVVLADLQFDVFDEHTKSALRLAMRERPDVLLLPGDFVQRTRRRGGDAVRREANAFLREIHFGAPLGVYAVEGNVEWEPGWEGLFEGLTVHTFSNVQRIEGEELVVTGMGLRESANGSQVIEGASGAGRGRFHIAIGHAPDFAMGDVRADLLVAGHTHGGQVQLPIVGPLLTLSGVPREWAAGNRAIALSGGRTLIVSRGVGHERGSAPRLRFRCKPEVVVIELRPRG